MLRVILLLIALFLIWVLFFSGFKKVHKIAISIVCLILVGLGIWTETQYHSLSSNLTTPDQVMVCGIELKHTYRTNFDANICLKNQASNASIRRIKLRYTALICQPDCQTIESVEKERFVDLPSASQITLTDNLRFDEVDPKLTQTPTTPLQWRVEVLEVKSQKVNE